MRTRLVRASAHSGHKGSVPQQRFQHLRLNERTRQDPLASTNNETLRSNE